MNALCRFLPLAGVEARRLAAILCVALPMNLSAVAPATAAEDLNRGPSHDDRWSAAQRAARAVSAADTLEVLAAGANETCAPQLLLCGQVVRTTLATTDCAVSNGFADLWFFPNYSQQAVGVGVGPTGFDALFGIIDPAGQVLAANVAPAGGVKAVGAFLRSFGNFKVLVGDNSSTPSKTGDYILSLVCGGPRCASDVATTCLQRNRFRVQVAWHNQYNDTYGFGRALPVTDQAGFYSFGDPNNVELLIKILDFGGGNIKVFFGELTDLQFSVAVSDMDDPLNRTKTYHNTSGNCGGIDQNFAAAESSLLPAGDAASGACRSDGETTCLLGGRFAVTMNWHNQYNGSSGTGGAVDLSDLSGAFYFTDSSNLELVVKMINFGDRIAVFYGALSDLEYSLVVRDTLTGTSHVYHNAPGHFCGGIDNLAFH